MLPKLLLLYAIKHLYTNRFTCIYNVVYSVNAFG